MAWLLVTDVQLVSLACTWCPSCVQWGGRSGRCYAQRTTYYHYLQEFRWCWEIWLTAGGAVLALPGLGLFSVND